MVRENNAAPCVLLRNLQFSWRRETPVLEMPAFNVPRGEKLFLQGRSGSGKSTLLGIIAGVYAPTSGEAVILEHPFHHLSSAQRDRVRADSMGVIFQQFNLVPYLSLVDNVLLPCRFSKTRAERVGASDETRVQKARDILGRLGLDAEARERRSAAELSVGQQQRVAAARALIGAPSLVIADEPTSALDTATRDAFIKTLLSEANDAAVIFVSHDASLAKRFDRQVEMDAINALSTSDATSDRPSPLEGSA